MKSIKNNLLSATGVLAACLLTAAPLQAANVTVDFDSTLPTYVGLSSYSEDGFTLASNVPDGTLIDDNNTVRANIGILGGGTNSQSLFFGENGSNSVISISNDNGYGFGLVSLDASSLYNATGQLTLTGTLSQGGVVSQVLTLNSNISTYAISGMTGLNGLTISFDGATYSAPYDLDNIEMSVVPVPAAVWLLGSALVGLFGWSRAGRAG